MVIAIIAILAAILFPVFAQAREKARRSAPLSNLKQIGTAGDVPQDYDEINARYRFCPDRAGDPLCTDPYPPTRTPVRNEVWWAPEDSQGGRRGASTGTCRR